MKKKCTFICIYAKIAVPLQRNYVVYSKLTIYTNQFKHL